MQVRLADGPAAIACWTRCSPASPSETWQSSNSCPTCSTRVARGDTLSQIAETYRDARVHAGGAQQPEQLAPHSSWPATAPARRRTGVAVVSAPTPVGGRRADVSADAPAIEARRDSITSDTGSDGWSAISLQGCLARFTTLLSDPSDYSVAADGSIEVQPLETLGHYGDWLADQDAAVCVTSTACLFARRLRWVGASSSISALSMRRLSRNERVAFHRQQQDSFFREHIIIRRHRAYDCVAANRSGCSHCENTTCRSGCSASTTRNSTCTKYSPERRVRFPVLTDVAGRD